jgi:protein-S-isoprenylcysteine O-methyltransferase Ste14
MNTEAVFRIAFFIILVLMFLISAYYRGKARVDGEVIDRKEEGLLVLALRMVLALPLLASFLAYIIVPDLLAWSSVIVPIWLRTLFLIVAILCLPILLWVFRSIGRNISETILIKSDHELVTAGPYKWVRHPLYATALLILCSFSIIASNWFIFLYFIIAMVIFRFLVIPEEEKKLIEVFGKEYQDYIKRTGALVPKNRFKKA